jgi:hypothetical protein
MSKELFTSIELEWTKSLGSSYFKLYIDHDMFYLVNKECVNIYNRTLKKLI